MNEVVAMKFSDEAGTQRYEVDESQLDRGVPTTPYDAPVRTLINEIQDKSLIVNPSFQRYNVWNKSKQSKLVESLLLNIPIPVLYFAEDDDGTRVVVDGQQRLRAIEEFYTGTLRLQGLEVLSTLNGLRWTDLTSKHSNIILRRTLRCVVISASAPPSLRFEMFERLNTGGVVLNDQELRNCILYGRFNDFLKSMALNEKWQAALGISKPDKRMNDMELVLRFFSLKETLATYRPPLKETLNNYMRSHRNPDDDVIRDLENTLLETVEKARDVFGDRLFRRVRVDDTGGQSWDRNINRAVFDVQMLAFSSLDRLDLRRKAADVRMAFVSLCAHDREFWESVSLATANRAAVMNRLRTWGIVLDGLGLSPDYMLTLPEN